MSRKLRDLEIDEISLVDEAATRKKFMIIKSVGVIQMQNIAELIQEFSDEVFDVTLTREDFEKKDIPQGVKDALKKALESINQYKDDFPENLTAAIKMLLKFVAVSAGLPAGESPGKKKVKKQLVKYWPSFDFAGSGKEEVEKINKAPEGGKFPSLTAQIFGKGKDDEDDED